ncbi:MAG: hypothetical protein M1334_02045, partial [Patescibacteria group bacterium]|nr:hypothetical protein [Patescibacteria group bacterium]
MKSVKILTLLTMVLVFASLAKRSYAIEPLEEFLLNKNSAGGNCFTVLPFDSEARHPAWLIDLPNQLTSNFDYDGIVSVFSGDWKGTRSYNYDYDQRLIFHLPADEIFSAQVISYNLTGNYFSLLMRDPKSQVNVNDYENYLESELSYSATLASWKVLSFGIGVGYFTSNYGSTQSQPLIDWEVRLNPKDGFYFGFRHNIERRTLFLDENMFFSGIGNFSFNWSADNIQELNELYFYRSLDLGGENALVIKVDYAPYFLQNDLNEAEGSVSYSYRQRGGIAFFVDETEEKESGSINLKSLPSIPPIYSAIAKEYGVDLNLADPDIAEMSLNYQILRYGARTFGFLDSQKRHKIELGFSQGLFTTDLKGTTMVNIAANNGMINVGISPFSAKGNLSLREDRIEGSYHYFARDWDIGFGLGKLLF